MDYSSYSRLVTFIVCELTMPVKKHIFDMMLLDQGSLNHHFLTAAADLAKEAHSNQSNKNNPHRFKLKPQVKSQKKSKRSSINYSSNLKEPLNVKSTTEEDIPLIDPLNVEANSDCNLQNSTEQNMSTEVSMDVNNAATDLIVEETNQFSSDVIFDADNHMVIKEVEVEHDSTIEHFIDDSYDPDQFKVYETMKQLDPNLCLSDEEFFAKFRVSHPTFKNLVQLLANEQLEPIENLPVYKKLLIVLWLMGHCKPYKEAALMFEVSEESAYNCFYDVCATLSDKSESFIAWPTSKECNEIADRIEKGFGFPEVIGVLGCNYFSMMIPKDPLSRKEHFNGNLRSYCLALQIVCDDRFVIRDIFPGTPGGRTEAQVFKESPLYQQLKSKTLVESNLHILARAQYPQLPSMLTPYEIDDELVDEAEADFNDLHENICQLVDQTFLLLRERFTTLKRLDPEVASMVLIAACVIHNISIENGDTFDSEN